MKRPEFFIVGAPKCGTTAFYEYLKVHPDIFMPRKEVYYFGKDLTYRDPRPSEGYYLSLFQGAKKDQRAGEASVWYLYSTRAAEEIRSFAPNARILIFLRDPVEMLHALHSQHLANGNENIPVFEDALAAEKDRKQGKRIPPYIGCPYEGLYYSKVARYVEQVKRYFDVFGRERVRVLIMDEWSEDPPSSYQETLEFLEVRNDFTPEFNKVNPNQTVRNKALRDLFKRRPQWMIRGAKALIPSRKWRNAVLEKIEQSNMRTEERPPMRPETRNRLREELREEVKTLGELMERDLERQWWKEGSAKSIKY